MDDSYASLEKGEFQSPPAPLITALSSPFHVTSTSTPAHDPPLALIASPIEHNHNHHNDHGHSPRPSAFTRTLTYIIEETTFFRAHLAAFTLIPLIFSGIFYALNPPRTDIFHDVNPASLGAGGLVNATTFANGDRVFLGTGFRVGFLDSMFLCYSAMTVTGLSTVNLSMLTGGQQGLLFLLMTIGDMTIVSWVMVLIRKRFFITHCETVVARDKLRQQQRQQAQKLKSMSMKTMKSVRSSASFMRNISGPKDMRKEREAVPERGREGVGLGIWKRRSTATMDVRSVKSGGVGMDGAGDISRGIRQTVRTRAETMPAHANGELGSARDAGNHKPRVQFNVISPTPNPTLPNISELQGEDAGVDLYGYGGGEDEHEGNTGASSETQLESASIPRIITDGTTFLSASPKSHSQDIGEEGIVMSPETEGEGGGRNLIVDVERGFGGRGVKAGLKSPPVAGFGRSTTVSMPTSASLRMGDYPRHRSTRPVPFPRRTLTRTQTLIPSVNALPPSIPGIPSSKITSHPSKYTGLGGFPGPATLLTSAFRLAAPRSYERISDKLERSMTVHSYTTLGGGAEDGDGVVKDVKWLTFSGLVVGRNSDFRTESLSDEQLADVGGAEYRALKMLGWLVPAYFVCTQLLSALLFLPWLATSRKYEGVFEAQPKIINVAWFGFFQVMGAYTGGGLSLVDLGMVPFQGAYLMVATLIFVILAGNHALPIFLRFVIWTASKLFDEDAEAQTALEFLLEHPRRCFLYLFPSHQTWFLLLCLIAFSIIEWVAFLVLNIGLPAFESIPRGQRVITGLFQGLAARASGFSIVPLASLAPGLLFLYVVMMYIAVYPVALSIRSTNVYEERSLGIFESSLVDEEEPNDMDKIPSERERVGRYVGWHLKRQLSVDIWWLVWAVFLVAIIERKNLMDESKKWFDLFRVLFELVSAFGGIGLSLGFPNDNYSFVGAMSPLSKLVVIVIMVRGRHRGLPVAVDKAVLLPSELMARNDQNNPLQSTIAGGVQNNVINNNDLNGGPGVGVIEKDYVEHVGQFSQPGQPFQSPTSLASPASYGQPISSLGISGGMGEYPTGILLNGQYQSPTSITSSGGGGVLFSDAV